MTTDQMQNEHEPVLVPLHNGPAAAAILAAGMGACSMGIFYVAGDVSKSLAKHLSLYPPAGPLSGVSSAAILVWLVAWAVLAARWKQRDVRLGRVNIAAFLLLFAGVLLTFPPVARLF